MRRRTDCPPARPAAGKEEVGMPPVHIMLKPASGLCNMRCRYCFYADEMKNRAVSSYGLMSEDTLEAIVRKTEEAAEGTCTFGLQGGEPTLAGLDFFRTLTALQKKYNTKGLVIHNALQTNGFLIDERWAEFFAENGYLVGISLDGTRGLHDLYRRDAEDRGTFDRVMRSISLLERYGVEYNILTVVTAQTAKHIGEVYRFFARKNLRYQQYIPCLDPLEAARGERRYSLTPELYGRFLTKLFDLWYEDVVHGRFIYIRYFENLLGMMLGRAPESCGVSGVCSRQYVVESDGSVYPCDFYMLDEYRLGSLVTDSFEQLEQRRAELHFIEDSAVWPRKCRDCRWAGVCRDGCRRDRVPDTDQTSGLNYFCSAYQSFFSYAMPRLSSMRREILRNTSAGRTDAPPVR